MDIRVYLTSGSILDFSQQDASLAAQDAGEIQPARVFAAKTLIIGNAAACNILQTSTISRIDIHSATPIAIGEGMGESTVIEDEETFRLRAKAASAALQEGAKAGETYEGYVAFELAGGHRLFMEIKRQLQQQIQMFMNLNRLFDLPAITVPHPRGGAVLLNTANITTISFHPGLSDYPKGSWIAARH
ncbi:MAG: hypothetical protein L6Q60_05015 [Rhodocyclaceae bacterium]|nr:hypothetical protein [Rhodocyclaceae bacterium]